MTPIYNRRRLAAAATRIKSEVVAELSSRDGFKDMNELFMQSKNGWSSDTYDHYAHATRFMFEHMKCVAAAPDAIHLLDHAARSLPDDMDVFNMRPEMSSGFLFLGEPMRSGSNQIAAFMWSTLPKTYRPDDLSPNPFPVLIVATLTIEGGFGLKNWKIYRNRTFANMRDSMVQMREDVNGEPATPESINDAITDLRVVIAFNLLLAQKVVETEEIQPTRQMRRQAARHYAPLDPVVLVQLPIRHHAHSNGNGATPIDWTHRWIVSGHWRKQWYSTDQVHRPKWIAPHIKGPDDKPLVVKEKLYIFDPPKETE